jgi:hypothetical protein
MNPSDDDYYQNYDQQEIQDNFICLLRDMNLLTSNQPKL